MSQLLNAAKAGNLERVQELVAAQDAAKVKAFVNTDDGWGNASVLSNAVKSGNLELVQWLVDQGADVNDSLREVSLSLSAAAETGNLPMMQFLFNKAKGGLFRNGADLNSKGLDGRGVVFLAARSGNFALMQWLKEQGVDLQVKDDKQVNILHGAVESGNLKLVQWLVEENGLDINNQDRICNLNNHVRYAFSVLQNAAKSGNLKLVQWLVEQGLAIKEKTDHGRGVLYNAIGSGNLELVKWLVEKGADLNTVQGQYSHIYFESPLKTAAQSGSLELVQWLIEEQGVEFETDSLPDAVFGGNLALVKWVINKGAVVVQGILSSAVKNLNMVKFLASKGESLLQSGFLFSAGKNTELIKWLVEEQGIVLDGNTLPVMLRGALGEQNLEVAKFLLNKNTTLDVNEMEVLDLVLLNLDLEVISYFLEKGLDLNYKRDGETVLYGAARKNNIVGLKFLLDMPGVEVNHIGPGSLLDFFQTNEKLITDLRARGVLEARGDGVHGRNQSVHAAETERIFAESMKNLKKKNRTDLNAAYEDCKTYLLGEVFQQDLLEISKKPHGFGEGALLEKIQECDSEVLLGYLQKDVPAIFDRMEKLDPINYPGVPEQFKEVIGLLWTVLQKQEGWLALKDLPEDKKEKELENLRLAFWEGLFVIQYEYFRSHHTLGQAQPSCGPGTVILALAMFSLQHEDILVTDQRLTPEYSKNAPLDQRLLADNEKQLRELIELTYDADLFESLAQKLGEDLEALSRRCDLLIQSTVPDAETCKQLAVEGNAYIVIKPEDSQEISAIYYLDARGVLEKTDFSFGSLTEEKKEIMQRPEFAKLLSEGREYLSSGDLGFLSRLTDYVPHLNYSDFFTRGSDDKAYTALLEKFLGRLKMQLLKDGRKYQIPSHWFRPNLSEQQTACRALEDALMAFPIEELQKTLENTHYKSILRTKGVEAFMELLDSKDPTLKGAHKRAWKEINLDRERWFNGFYGWFSPLTKEQQFQFKTLLDKHVIVPLSDKNARNYACAYLVRYLENQITKYQRLKPQGYIEKIGVLEAQKVALCQEVSPAILSESNRNRPVVEALEELLKRYPVLNQDPILLPFKTEAALEDVLGQVVEGEVQVTGSPSGLLTEAVLDVFSNNQQTNEPNETEEEVSLERPHSSAVILSTPQRGASHTGAQRRVQDRSAGHRRGGSQSQ